MYKRKPHVSRTRESVRWTFAGILVMYHHRPSRSKPSRWVPNAMTCAVDGLIIHEDSKGQDSHFSLTHSLTRSSILQAGHGHCEALQDTLAILHRFPSMPSESQLKSPQHLGIVVSFSLILQAGSLVAV